MNVTIKEVLSFSLKNLRKHFRQWVLFSLISIGMSCFMVIGCLLPVLLLDFLHIPKPVLGFIMLFILPVVFWGLYRLIVVTVNYCNLQKMNALDLAQGNPMRGVVVRRKDSALLRGFVLYRLLFSLILSFIMLLGNYFGSQQVLPGYLVYFILLQFISVVVMVYFVSMIYVRLYFYSYVLLDEGCGVLEAFSKSWRITKGHFWGLFLLVFTDLCSPILFILNLFVPVQDLPAAYLYVHYKKLKA